MNEEKPRILRIITRMNTGGPSRQAALLTVPGLEEFETLLLFGNCEAGEQEDTRLTQWVREKSLRVSSLRRSIHPFRDIQAFWAIRKAIRSFKPHIVHTHTAKAGILGRLAAYMESVPVIIHTFHGHTFHNYFSEPLNTFFLNVERMLASLSTHILVLSPSQYQEITHTFKVGNARRNRIVPLGLQLDPFLETSDALPADWYSSRNLSMDYFYISWCGRLVSVKDPLLLVEIATRLNENKRLPEWKILVAGDGPLASTLTQKIKEANLEHRFRLLSWETDMVSFWRASQIALQTSLNEGTPVSLIEAMASGVPVVATHVGGVGDITGDGQAALLTPPKDADALAMALSQLMITPELRKKMSDAGKIRVKPFHFRILCQNLIQLYHEALQGNYKTY